MVKKSFWVSELVWIRNLDKERCKYKQKKLKEMQENGRS